jgi:cell division protein FtsB
MKRFMIILPFFLGTLIYTVTSVCFGPGGIQAMRQLERNRILLAQNLDELYAVQTSLDGEFRNLSADPDTISVYAHELGYVTQGEKLIKLAGFSGGIDRNLTCGEAIKTVPPVYLPEWMCKFMGILTGALAYVGFFILPKRKSYACEKK